jgi:Ca-activated chloride channel family protein
MAGLSSTVARGITLTIQPASGVSVVRVYGYPVDVSGGYQVIKVGSLSSGQVREILLRVQVPEGESATADLAKFALSFRDLVAGGTPVEDGVGLAVRTSADPEAVKKSERAEVAVRAAEVESADEMEKAAKAVDRGDYGAARTIIQSNIGRLREQAAATPSARLDTQMKSMEEAWGGVGKAEAGPPGAAQEFIKGSKARAYDLSK